MTREEKSMFKFAVVGIMLTVFVNLLFWGGLIYVVFLLLRHFSVI